MKKTFTATLTGLVAVTLLAGCSTSQPVEPAASTESAVEVPTSEFSQELHDALPEDIKEAGVISVAGETNQPWRIVAADGSVKGLGEDFLSEFETILGVEFETEMVQGLPAVKLGFQSGRNDIGFGPLLITPTTIKDVTFVEYLYGRPGLVYSVDGEKITELLDICGKTVAYLDGSAAWAAVFDEMDARCPADERDLVERLPLADINSAILAVKSGRADLAGVGAHQSAYSVQEDPENFLNYIATAEEWKSDLLGMGFEVSDVELAEVMLGAWQEVFDSGVYAALMENYGLTEIAVGEPVLHVGGE